MQKKKFKAVELKHLDQETIEQIREWRNQDFVRQVMFSQDIIDRDTHNQWIERIRQDKNRYLFVCYLNDKPFGVIQYVYRLEHEAVETGYYLIDEDYQYMGYGVIMAYFMGEIIYQNLGFEKVYGQMISNNTRAVRLDRFLEGKGECFQNVAMIDGKKYDVIVSYGNRVSWEQYEKPKLLPLVSKMIDLNYIVIM